MREKKDETGNQITRRVEGGYIAVRVGFGGVEEIFAEGTWVVGRWQREERTLFDSDDREVVDILADNELAGLVLHQMIASVAITKKKEGWRMRERRIYTKEGDDYFITVLYHNHRLFIWPQCTDNRRPWMPTLDNWIVVISKR